MFVEFAAVLYELRLKRLKRLHERAQAAYKAAFLASYKCSDELVALKQTHDATTCRQLREGLKPSIAAAGGRLSKAEQRAAACEKIAGAINYKLVRTERRLIKLEALRTRSRQSSMATGRIIPQ